MKNIYISILFFLIINNFAFSTNKSAKILDDPNVTIEILNVVTNGVLLPNNTFSFNGVNDLEIEFDIKTTYSGSNSNFYSGQVSAYFYEPNSFDNETAEYYNNGVNPLYIFKNDITLVSNGTSRSCTLHKKLYFKRNTIYNAGCSLVFRYYATNTFPFTRLTKLTYSIIGGTKTGNTPTVLPTSNVTLNNISYSNGQPLINNEIVVPSGRIFAGDVETLTRSINLSFNYNATHGSDLTVGYYPHMRIQMIGNDAGGNLVGTDLSGWFLPTDMSGTCTFNDVIIKSSDIAINSYLRIILSFQGTNVFYNCGLIKSSRPINNNIIGFSQTILTGQIPSTFSCSQPTIWTSGGTCSPGLYCPMVYSNVTNFQWQTKNSLGVWTNIIGATNKNYSPTSPITTGSAYRRFAYYNGLYSISNENYVVVDTSITNTICCNQNMYVNIQPQPITGNDPSLSTKYRYQWQIANPSTFSSTLLYWSSIPNATEATYTHIFNEVATRDTEKTRFRRLIIQNNNVTSISNEVLVTRRGTNTISKMSPSYLEKENNEIIPTIYPNPFDNVLNITLNDIDINADEISFYDASNRLINLNMDMQSKSITIDTSTLSKGFYILKMKNLTYTIIKK